ncbi:MAG: hypothetical protein ACE5G1_05720, partial [bacterium]
MSKDNLIKILLGFIGCVFIVAFFVIVSQLNSFNLLKPSLPKTEILDIAETAFLDSRLAEYDLKRSIDLDLDDNLSKYAQIYLNNQRPDGFFPLGAWKIEYSGKIQTKKEGE